MLAATKATGQTTVATSTEIATNPRHSEWISPVCVLEMFAGWIPGQ